MALPAILGINPRAKVVILSGNCEEGSAAAVEALALGASDILAKLGSGSFGEHFPQGLIDRLLSLFRGAASPVTVRPTLRIDPEQEAKTLACLGLGARHG